MQPGSVLSFGITYNTMRPLLFLLPVPVLFACACNPDLEIESGPTFHSPLSPRSECVVLGLSDTIAIRGDTIGRLSYAQTMTSIPWYDMQITRYFQTEALHNGGNLVKITKYGWSGRNEEVVEAAVYRVDNIHHYEKQIEWSASRKLQLSDFKGPPDREPAGKPSLQSYSGCDFYLFSRSKFYCYYSWIDPRSADSLRLLLHEQGNFDLCEVYRRQLDENVMRYENSSGSRYKMTERVFKQVYSAYLAKQAQYESETGHGLDPARQAEWTKRIAAELADPNGTHDPFFAVDPLFTQRQKDSAVAHLTPVSGKALVYIIRPQNISTPLVKRVLYDPIYWCVFADYAYFINRNQYTVDFKDSTTDPIKGRTFTYRYLDPDQYTFTPVMNKQFERLRLNGFRFKTGAQMKLSLTAGKVYYLKMTTGATWFGFARPQLEVLNEREGKALLRRCNVALANDNIDLPELGDPLE